jgi:propanol-preferring alcohol dehydrogenase
MGLRVAAVDIADDKLELAKRYGAEVLVNSRSSDPGRVIQDRLGGTHGAVVTAVSPEAFEQSTAVLRPGGAVSFIGLPGGDNDRIRLAISSLVNGELTVRGSNVGTRQDLNEALAFAGGGLVKAVVEKQPLGEVNSVLERMRRGEIVGRVVLAIA